MEILTIAEEIETLPPEVRQEVIDFVGFLKTKYTDKKLLKEREFGFAMGKVRLHEDFDAPLDEFKLYTS